MFFIVYYHFFILHLLSAASRGLLDGNMMSLLIQKLGIMSKVQQNKANNNQIDQKVTKKIYEFLYIITVKSYPTTIIDPILIAINILINLCFFISSANIKSISINKIVLPQTLIIFLLAIISLILFQILFGIVYLKQFYLKLQFKVFRYVIFPIQIYFLLNYAFYGQMFEKNQLIGIIIGLIIIYLCLTVFLTSETFTERSIYLRRVPINFYLLICEVLLIFSQHFQNMETSLTIVSNLILVSVLTRLICFPQIASIDNQYHLLRVAVQLYVLYSLNIFFNLVFSQKQYLTLWITVFSCCCIAIVDFLNPIEHKLNIMSVFSPKLIKSEVFVQRIQYLIFQIMKIKDIQNPQFTGSLIISFCYQHQKNCNMPSCKLLADTKKGMLANINDAKTVKEMISCISRKIELLFIQVVKNQPENKQLKISILKFYQTIMPNKIKMSQFLSEIGQNQVTLFQQIEIYRLKKCVMAMEASESIDPLQLDDSFAQFQSRIFPLVNLMVDFWSQFLQERIDFNKLLLISEKIYPSQKIMQELVQKQYHVQNYTTVKILQLYAQYCLIVLNDDLQTNIIKDFIGSLSQRLFQKKELKYLSSDRQVGVITISLSEDKLGSIVMVNQQIANIFGYKKKQVLKKRVNDIMPRLISIHHDKILEQFLKNRNKRVNSNQRHLFGKAKNGYIFPLFLKLQRAIGASNQELIFVGIIKKTQQSHNSIMCITKEDGHIEDYSETFKKLFLKKRQKRVSNIQQIVTDFFTQIQSKGDSSEIIITTQILTSLGYMNFTFNIQEINFAFQKNIGYVIKGEIKNQQEKSKTVNSINKGVKTAGMISLNIPQNYHYIDSRENNKRQRQTSILQTPEELMSQLVSLMNIDSNIQININLNQNQNTKKNHYDQNIKTIRLIKDHFERVEEKESFESYSFEETDFNYSINHRLQQLKDAMGHQHDSSFINHVNKIILLVTALFIIFGVLTISQNFYQQSKIYSSLQIQLQNAKIRGSVSEFVIYFSRISDKSSNETFYSQKLLEVQTQTIKMLNTAKITQLQKQTILKLLLLQQSYNFQQALSDPTLKFTKDQQLIPIFACQILLIILLGIQLIVLAYTFIKMKSSLYDVFSMFLTIQQKTIRKVYENYSKFLKIIQKSISKRNTSETLEKIDTNQFDEQECPVQKIKKFKNTYRDKDKIILAKLLFPTIVCISILIGLFVLQTQERQQYLQKTKLLKHTACLVSQSSVILMKSYISKIKHFQLNISDNFQWLFQNFQRNIQILQQDRNIKQSLYDLLFQNVCQLDNMPSECPIFMEGIMMRGLSKAVNYIATNLHSINQPSFNISSFDNLIILQYRMIKPVLENIVEKLRIQIVNSLEKQNSLFTAYVIVIISIFLIGNLILLCYSFKQIEKQLSFAKGLIKIMPNTSNPSKNGYSKI